MLARYYIEALLADEVLADEIWLLWDAGVIDDNLAALLWLLMTAPGLGDIMQNRQSAVGGLAEKSAPIRVSNRNAEL